MKKRILIALLRIARAVGAFSLARWLTRGQLRILCYHGAAVAGENAFRGGLFIDPARFRRRLALLAAQCYPVLPLGEALARLDADTLPPAATVITIDDGWIGTATAMAPALKDFNFPATLYVASYYLEKQTMVFNVAVDYVMWRAPRSRLDLGALHPALEGVIDTGLAHDREAATRQLCRLGDTLPGALERQALLRDLCRALGVDVAQLEASRVMSFMTADEAREIRSAGVDLQLHTHRHRFPADDRGAAEREIADNRRSLARLSDQPLVDFCYPSGEYQPHQIDWLKACGVRSATTTRSGFNYRSTNRFELTRFLDSESISDIEFEAEMSGLLELVRRCGIAI